MKMLKRLIVCFIVATASVVQAQVPYQQAAVYNVSGFAGATAGAKIAACLAALPSTGGVCDTRSLPSGGTIPAMTITNSGATILGPCGSFTVSGTITLSNGTTGMQQDRWTGCNSSYASDGTTFVWGGNTTAPMFLLQGVRDSILEGFQIKSSSSAPLAVGIQSATITTAVTSHNTYRRLVIDSTSSTGLGIGIQWCRGGASGCSATTGPDANNDASYVENVSVTNYNTAAFSIEHGESQDHLFIRDQCLGDTYGQYCITTALGGAIGNFMAVDVSGSGNTVADYYLGGVDGPILIVGGNFENSNEFMNFSGGSAQGFPITILGVRWAANNIGSNNHILDYTDHGGLNITGMVVDSPKSGSSPIFYLAPAGTPGAGATAIGNTIFWSTATATSQPFVGSGAQYWRLLGNIVTDSSADAYQVPDQVGGNLPLGGMSGTYAQVSAVQALGMHATITDGKAANCGDSACTTWGTTITGGGGSLRLSAWYNGSNWTLEGK